MRFEATKCDECGRIQGEANHWQQVQVWTDKNNPAQCYGVALGGIVGSAMAAGAFTMSASTMPASSIHDLCGQSCAMKHVARLLGWTAE